MISLLWQVPALILVMVVVASALIVRPRSIHWQNLTREDSRDTYESRFPWNGRAWLHGKDGYRGRALQIEWCIGLSQGLSYGFEIGEGDSGHGLQFTFGIPFVATVYWTIEGFFKVAPFGYGGPRWCAEQGEGREFSIRYHDGAIWWHFGVGSMADWSRSYPWCKPWRQGNFAFASLLGKQTYNTVTLRGNIPVEIPMPEGVYHGVAKVERSTCKRPLWFARTRVSTWIDVAKGIPFQGKGENSYDCGDDGLHGAGVEGDDVAKAVRHFQDTVIKNRSRYGAPSEQAIREALMVAVRP